MRLGGLSWSRGRWGTSDSKVLKKRILGVRGLRRPFWLQFNSSKIILRRIESTRLKTYHICKNVDYTDGFVCWSKNKIKLKIRKYYAINSEHNQMLIAFDICHLFLFFYLIPNIIICDFMSMHNHFTHQLFV